MKRLILVLCAISLATTVSAGNNAFDGTTFTISSNVALPVHVRFGGKEITISSYQYTTYTRIPNATITDAHGRNCIYRHSYDSHSGSNGSYVHHYYNITGVYSSSTSSSNSSSGGSSGSSYSSYSDDSRAAQLGAAWANAARATSVYDSYAGYKAGGFSLSAGISAAWGENLELRFRYGSSNFGGDVTGMVGYDWINHKEGEKVLWNVGLGMYFGNRTNDIYLWDVGFGIKFGKSTMPYNNTLDKDAFTMLVDANTTHLLGPEHVIGLTAGLGIGIGGAKHVKFAWDARVGIVVYFLQWNWL